MLSRRQITVQRDNLASMCRISVKCLLDYACLYTHVNDDSEEFINFCAVFEQLVSHRLRPYHKKAWLPGQGSPRHFWDVLLENHNRSRGFLFQTCIPNIEAIETIKSPKAKLRAFIRVALMEKRLSDYLSWVLGSTTLIRESYFDGALMASEEATVLCGELIGLNAIDFNFCLKGNENELLGPLEISYSPFLTYKQTSASRCSDEIEMLRLSGKDIDEVEHAGSVLTESNVNAMLCFQRLEQDVGHIKEQKDYLEELLRLRDRQLTDANIRIMNMTADWQQRERSMEKERVTMESCVLELQEEMAKLQKSNDSLKSQMTSLKQKMELREVPLTDMALSGDCDTSKDAPRTGTENMHEGFTMAGEIVKREATLTPFDQRSIKSFTSDGLTFTEDSQSLVPLTGSLADVSLAILESHTKEEHPVMEKLSKKQDNPQSEIMTLNMNVTETTQDQYAENTSQKKECDMETVKFKIEDDHNVESEMFSRNEEPVQHLYNQSFMMAESYVVTKEEDILNPLRSQPLDNSANATEELEDGAAASSFGFTGRDSSNPAISDGSSSNAESEKEEGIMSELEIINAGNISSDGSDAAWEVMSASDHSDLRGAK